MQAIRLAGRVWCCGVATVVEMAVVTKLVSFISADVFIVSFVTVTFILG